MKPFAVLTTEAWGNVAGGLEQKGWWNHLLNFGAELDTAKLGWWEGGCFVLEAHWVQNLRRNASFSDYTGAFNPVSGVAAHDHLRIYNFYYQHSWVNHTLELKVGQLAADDDFMGSEYAGLFLNSAFGAMPSQVGTPLATCCGNSAAFPIYSVAAPGMFLRAHPWEPFYTQVGLYYGRPGLDKRSNYGFDWASESPAELGLFWENGIAFRIGQRAATSRLGLSYHTGPVDDFTSITASQEAGTKQAVPNFYFVQDLALILDRDNQTRLGLFARCGVTPNQARSMVGAYADAGLNWFGPLPGRQDDTAGVAISYTRFGRAFRESTGTDGMSAGEGTLELTYQARLARWMLLQADLQLVLNPAVNPDSGSRETAIVLGVRTEISL